MNKERRKLIEDLISEIDDRRDGVETVRDEEQEYADDMPDNLHGSERHEKAEETVAFLEEAVDGLGTVLEALRSAKED